MKKKTFTLIFLLSLPGVLLAQSKKDLLDLVPAFSGVSAQELVGQYSLRENFLYGQWNACPQKIEIIINRNKEGQREIILNDVIAKWPIKIFAHINEGEITHKKYDAVGSGQSQITTETTLERNGWPWQEERKKNLELVYDYNYSDSFLPSSDASTILSWDPEEKVLHYQHNDIFTMKWYQFETGVDRNDPRYQKPNYDKDCDYRKIYNKKK